MRLLCAERDSEVTAEKRARAWTKLLAEANADLMADTKMPPKSESVESLLGKLFARMIEKN